jgi:hypothetical protein
MKRNKKKQNKRKRKRKRKKAEEEKKKRKKNIKFDWIRTRNNEMPRNPKKFNKYFLVFYWSIFG